MFSICFGDYNKFFEEAKGVHGTNLQQVTKTVKGTQVYGLQEYNSPRCSAFPVKVSECLATLCAECLQHEAKERTTMQRCCTELTNQSREHYPRQHARMSASMKRSVYFEPSFPSDETMGTYEPPIEAICLDEYHLVGAKS